MPTTEQTLAVLRSLAAGDRAWFLLDPEVPPWESPLWLVPFSHSTRPLTGRTRGWTGFLSVGDDGVHRFLGRDLGVEALRALAEWVAREVLAWADLRRLCAAEVIGVDADGRVASRHADGSLWPDPAPRPALGSREHAAWTLQHVGTGDEAWLWATVSGPGGTPRPLLVSTRRGEPAFARQVVRIRRRSDPGAPTVHGTLACHDDGRLELAVPGLRDRPVVDAVAGTDARLRPLLPALARHEMRSQCRWLETEERLVFGFHLGQLRVHPAADALVPEGVRGVLRLRRGGFVFQTRDDVPDLLAWVAAWVQAHHDEWPGLRVLVGARHRVRPRDAEEPEIRYADAGLWAFGATL